MCSTRFRNCARSAAVGLALLASLAAPLAASATSSPGDPGPAKTVHIIGTEGLGDNVPGGQIYQYREGRVVIRPGGSIRWVNQTMDPHTVVIVPSYADEQPDKVVKVVNPGFVPDGEHMPPFVPALNAYEPTGDFAMRLEVPGDAIVVAVQGETAAAIGGGVIHDTERAAIVAPAGTRLYYYCAFHPWMEGRIDVIQKGMEEEGS